jgi:hypothetical protein
VAIVKWQVKGEKVKECSGRFEDESSQFTSRQTSLPRFDALSRSVHNLEVTCCFKPLNFNVRNIRGFISSHPTSSHQPLVSSVLRFLVNSLQLENLT